MSDPVEPFEIWASPEPTVARIDAGTYRDQLAETGHEFRDGDMALLAGLGVHAVRYPVLWEKCAPGDPAEADFRWATRRLSALRDAGIAPIVTLLHHGSGPPHTNLLDPAFPDKLAAYAAAAADAFPWVERWTPINEPLTTARFSTLYGLWYPNATNDDVAFAHAIAHSVLGMLYAMEAIRTRVPHATFVVTEDLQSFRALDDDAALDAYVRHKRERMYLSIELAMGRVVPGHALYGYLTERGGVAPSLLATIASNAATPDLVAWNYYPNSERVLSLGPGGAFVNRPRVVHEPGSIAAQPLLQDAYERLRLPFALGEVHVNADERGRVRWLAQRYAECVQLRRWGYPMRAFGVWAAFGLVDWDSLLTRRDDEREDGIFTFAAPDQTPQRTAVADAVGALVRGEPLSVPPERGWWETRGVPR